MMSRISASVAYWLPGKNSSPTMTLDIAPLPNASRARLKAAMASCWSISVFNQLGLMMGASAMSLDEILTLPRDVVTPRAARIVEYSWPSLG